MSIDAKHFYRFTYLKSEHWEQLRLSKLAQQHGKCKLCKVDRYDHDVHHIFYRNLYDVKLTDLVVLCRSCHIKVHRVLDGNFGIKDAETAKGRWRKTWKAIRRQAYQDLIMLGIHPMQKEAWARKRFRQARHRLRQQGLIMCSDQMRFSKRFYKWWKTQWSPTDLEILEASRAFDWPCGEH